MKLVVDTSIIVAVLITEPEREIIIRNTKNYDLVAPGSVHWEIGNALVAMLKKGRINLAQIKAVLKAYDKIPIRFLDVDLELAMEISSEYNLYAYDAYIIACARENRCSLISLDRNLINAARKARISIVEV